MGLYKGESFTEDEYKNINAATGKPFGQAGEEAVQNKAQEWRNQGSPVPGTKQPEDIRSLGQQIIDWAGTPAGNATLGGLGLLAAGAYGLSKRKTTPEAAPKVEPYVSPSYDYETTATEVPERKGLPQPSTPVAEPTPTPTAPSAPTAPTAAPAGTTPVATQQPAISGYGQQTINAPTGAPSPVVPTSPVQPVDPAVQAKVDAIAAAERRKQEAHDADQRRKQELHEKRLAGIDVKNAKKDAENLSKLQGVSAEEVNMLKRSEKAGIDKAAESSVKSAVKTNPPVAGTPVVAPAAPVTTPAATTPAATPITPATPAPSAVEPVVPEGRIPNYMEFKKKKSGSLEYKNKQGSDVIGKGGWNWYQGQMGPEAEKNWLQTFGRTNQTTRDVQQAMKEGRLKGPEVVEGRGGSFKRETTVPEYIRGSAPVETIARTGLAALGILPVAKKIKEGDYKGALNELIPASAMIDPRISLALSPLYTSDEEIKILKEAEQKRKVGAGRGIAPPSDYLR